MGGRNGKESRAGVYIEAGNGGSSFSSILSPPSPALIHLPRSIQACASKVVDADPHRPIKAREVCAGAKAGSLP